MEQIKLIAVDMDGTFLTDDKNYDQETFEALYAKMKEQGIKFVVASGNQYAQLKTFFGDYQDELTYVAENGALIVENNEVIFSTEIYYEYLTVIKDVLRQHKKIDVCLCGLDSAYILAGKTEFYEAFQPYYRKLKFVENFEEINDTIIKIALRVPQKQTKKILKILEKELGHLVTAVSSGHGSIDLIVPGVNKGHGLQLLCKRWGLSLDECIAFGDGGNDVEMLETVGRSYAMENAPKEIHEVASHRAPSNNDFGVTQILKTLI